MNPLGFALAGAVLLTTSLAAFDTLGQAAAGQVSAAPSQIEERASPVQAATPPAAVEMRRPVRVILSSPYGRQG